MNRATSPKAPPLMMRPHLRQALALTLGLSAMTLFVLWQLPPYVGWYYGRDAAPSISFHAQFIAFVVAVVALAWGLSGALWPSRPRLTAEVGALGGLMLLAAALRLVGAGESIRVLVDELNTIAEVLALQQTPDIKLLWPMTTISPFPWLFAYGQYWGVTALGHHLGGLRAFSAIVAALSLWPLYTLARTLFSRRVALVAALLLATFPPHLHFGRLALLNIADALWGVWAIAFFARALRFNRRADWALAGVMLGLSQYFYEGGRLFFPLFMAIWALWLWLSGCLRGRRRGLLRFGLAAVLIGAPLYLTWALIDAPLAGRMGDAALGWDYWRAFLLSTPADGWLAVQLDQIARAFALYIALPDQSTFYGGQTALLLPILVPFFLFGLLQLSARPRRIAFVLPLWLFLTALGNGLFMLNSAAATRYVGVMPPLVLVTAYGLDRALAALAARRAMPPRVARRLIAAVVVALALGQVGYYFALHLPAYNLQIRAVRPWRDVEDAVFRALALPEEAQVHIITTYRFDAGYAGTLATFLNGAPRSIETRFNGDLDAAYIAALPRDRAHAFFVAPDDARTLALLRARFALPAPQYSPYAVPPEEQFALYYLPATETETP